MDEHPFDILIERIADTVVRKIQEQQQIDAVARAVIAYLSRQGQFATTGPSPVGTTEGETCADLFADTTEADAPVTPLATEKDNLPEEKDEG
jgi:hypothetical protein